MSIEWEGLQRIETQEYRCAFCDREVASDKGRGGREESGHAGARYYEYYYVATCPRCTATTLIGHRTQVPAPRFGEPVAHLPEDVASLYTEARSCMSVNAHTGAVLLGRKLLMHVAVTQGAEPGETFAHYVDYLSQQGVVTAGMRDWVNEIRELGNEANHELKVATREQAEELLTFVAMLLKVVYEYPELGRRSVDARKGEDES
jgi:hypothetical protein